MLWLVPVLGLAVFGIIDLLTVIPILGLLGFGVQVSENVILASDLLLGQEVLAFVVEDDVNLLGAGTANVRS